MRILVIEDDPDIALFLKSALTEEGFSLDVAMDGERGSYLARTNEYDLIILDFVLPKKDGKTICQEIRNTGNSVPIIMLTVRTEIPDKISMLHLGVDDYVTKPFSFDELVARIRTILKRPQVMINNPISFSTLTLDSQKQMAWKGKQEIYLTRKEFQLLELFMKNAGKVLSRGTIMEHVWTIDSDPFSNTIEAHVLNLRRKIDTGRQKLIHTVPGRGYKMDIKK